MKVVVIRDGFFYTGINGVPCSKIVNYNNFSSRYLSGFDSVELVGRLYNIYDPDALPIVGDRVSFSKVDGYTGLFGFLRALKNILSLAFSNINKGDAYILRLPATIPIVYGLILFLKKIPYGVELVGDPYDAYSKKVLSSKMAFFYQTIFTNLTRFIVLNSVTASYVTDRTLQLNYPTKKSIKNFSYTSLDIGDEAYVEYPRNSSDFTKGEYIISHVGMMAKNYKGHDILIDAVKIVIDRGYKVRVKFVGDGSERVRFEKIVNDFELNDYFVFLGGLSSGNKVREVLDSSDIFVLPSRQEGLPRAMIEAMARGIPCIGTRVGGIPELLDENSIVDVDDVLSLANKICEYIDNPTLMENLSCLLLIKSRRFHRDHVSKERMKFYKTLRMLS